MAIHIVLAGLGLTMKPAPSLLAEPRASQARFHNHRASALGPCSRRTRAFRRRAPMRSRLRWSTVSTSRLGCADGLAQDYPAIGAQAKREGGVGVVAG
jgi:hypothetical protein